MAAPLPTDLLLNVDPDLVTSQDPADQLKQWNNLAAILKRMYTDLADAINQAPEYAQGGTDANPAEGMFQVWQDGSGEHWLAYNDGGTVKKMQFNAPPPVIPVEVPAGSKVAFFQAAAPTGWTQDTSVNDVVLRAVSGSGGVGGGDWTISGLTVEGHALSIDEMPAHSHSYTPPSANYASITAGATITRVGAAAQTGSQGGGAAHSHGLSADGNWRPAYIDVIIASKD